jgi:hypothetical protein
LFPYYENATKVFPARWLTDTPIYTDAFEIVAEKARRFWWGQQINLATLSWSMLLAIEGRRRNIPFRWAFLALAHLVNLSFAQNLFYIALLLTPSPIPSNTDSSLPASRCEKAQAAKLDLANSSLLGICVSEMPFSLRSHQTGVRIRSFSS